MTKSYRLLSFLLGASLLGLAGCAANPADNVPKAGVGTPSQVSTGAPVAAMSATPLAANPAASVTPGVSGTPTSNAVGTVMPFAEGSEVAFQASKVTRSHDGGFKKISGSVTVPDKNVEKATIDVVIDMSSVYTDEEKLTGHLISPDFFDVAKNPTSTFKSTTIAETDNGYLVTGNLNLHGVTKPINFPAEIVLNGNELTTKAEFSINRKDFDIIYPGKSDDLIRDEVVIKFDLRANSGAEG